jgi:hypothetical protein
MPMKWQSVKDKLPQNNQRITTKFTCEELLVAYNNNNSRKEIKIYIKMVNKYSTYNLMLTLWFTVEHKRYAFMWTIIVYNISSSINKENY